MTEHSTRRGWQKEAEAAGEVADSMEVRLALMAKVHAGEITLEEAQRQLKSIKRKAKSNGQITRNQAYLGKVAKS
jgi:hypothetical protein